MRAYGSDELGGDCLLNLIRVHELLTNLRETHADETRVDAFTLLVSGRVTNIFGSWYQDKSSVLRSTLAQPAARLALVPRPYNVCDQSLGGHERS
jgi:hypothetical protein